MTTLAQHLNAAQSRLSALLDLYVDCPALRDWHIAEDEPGNISLDVMCLFYREDAETPIRESASAIVKATGVTWRKDRGTWIGSIGGCSVHLMGVEPCMPNEEVVIP